MWDPGIERSPFTYANNLPFSRLVDPHVSARMRTERNDHGRSNIGIIRLKSCTYPDVDLGRRKGELREGDPDRTDNHMHEINMRGRHVDMRSLPVTVAYGETNAGANSLDGPLGYERPLERERSSAYRCKATLCPRYSNVRPIELRAFCEQL